MASTAPSLRDPIGGLATQSSGAADSTLFRPQDSAMSRGRGVRRNSDCRASTLGLQRSDALGDTNGTTVPLVLFGARPMSPGAGRIHDRFIPP